MGLQLHEDELHDGSDQRQHTSDDHQLHVEHVDDAGACSERHDELEQPQQYVRQQLQRNGVDELHDGIGQQHDDGQRNERHERRGRRRQHRVDRVDDVELIVVADVLSLVVAVVELVLVELQPHSAVASAAAAISETLCIPFISILLV